MWGFRLRYLFGLSCAEAETLARISGPALAAILLVAPDGSAKTITEIVQGPNLSAPSGITVDASGNVYVAGTLSDNVFHIQLNDSCGDPTADGRTTVTDAFVVLAAAVGPQVCAPCVCDVDRSAGSTVTDVLIVLEFAVGEPIPLNCQQCP